MPTRPSPEYPTEYSLRWSNGDKVHPLDKESAEKIVAMWRGHIATYGGKITGSLAKGNLVYRVGYAALRATILRKRRT